MNLLIKGLLLFFPLLFYFSSFSQTCTGDVSLRSQQEVDEFINVSGGCTVIDGGLEIWDIDGDITSLAGISHIQAIKGDFEIYGCNHLKNLGALSSLDTLYGSLRIEYNDSLINIKELDNLVVLGSSIALYGEFTELPVLPGVDSLVHLSLDILKVTEINAFPNLKVVNSLYLSTSLLSDLTGFNSIEEISVLSIRGYESLGSLHGLENIEKLGELSITQTHSLQNLSGLDNLSVIHGRLDIKENLVLNSIDALQNLNPDSLDRVTFYNNPMLATCNLPFLCSALTRPDFLYGFNNNAPGCRSFWEVAENCQIECPPKIYFSAQSEVDSFYIRFPDCAFIEDDIIINSAVTNLDSLYHLTGLGGDLTIEYTKIKTLHGLDNLISIGGNVNISSNDSLLSLAGLEGITEVRNLYLERNYKLDDLSGLTNLREVNSIVLGNMKRIDGLNSLEKVSFEMSVYGKFNDLLQFTFPPLLDTIHGWLALWELDSLSTFPEASHLKSVGGLDITRTNFENLDGLSGLVTIGSHLNIIDNPKLQSLSGLDHIQSVGSYIEVSYNDVLVDFSALRPLEQVNGDLVLIGNSAITSLADLESIQSINGNFRVSGNPQLTTLTGIDNLQHLGGDLQLSQLSITDMSGLDQLIAIGGSLIVYSIPTLTSYHGLENLDSIYGEAEIWAIPSLGYPGLSNLEYVGGELSVSGASSVAGLDSLKSVGGLFIGNSSSLEDLSPFRNIQEIRGDMSIRNVRKVSRLPDWKYLREIGGDVFIQEIFLITDLSGLDSLRTIDGSLTLDYLDLESLKGLDQLQLVNGGLTLDNTYITDLDPLQNLHQINGPLQIINNDYVTNITGLSNVEPESVFAGVNEPVISIYGNQRLSDCAIELVCEALGANGKEVEIHTNSNGCNFPFQIEIQCLESACVNTDIYLQRQSQIDSFNLLYPGCGLIKGDLIIREESPGAIQQLDSLDLINTVGGHLEVFDNEELENVNGLSNLRRVGGMLRIVANDHLSSIEGFAQIDPALFGLLKSAPHDVTIINNPLLNDCAIEMVCKGFTIEGTSFSIFDNGPSCISRAVVVDHCNFPKQCAINGKVSNQYFIDLFPVNYPGCEVLNSDLIIEGYLNTEIISVHGFQQLKQINGDLMFINNDQYMELSGFDSLVEVKGRIVISNNDLIWSLNPLSGINPDSLRAESGEPLIEITNNEYLAICAIEPVCAALTNPNDSVLIQNNLTNCNSNDEVLAACIVSSNHPSHDIGFRIYPNPTTGELNFKLDQRTTIEIQSISVYDHMGSLVASEKFSPTMSLAHLNDGLYTLVFITSDHGFFPARVVLLKQ